jgi:hypothetical protein
MRIRFHWPSAFLGAAVACLLCMLSLMQPAATAQSDGSSPATFANAIEQRQEMIRLLRDQSSLAKEQLELLQSGKLRIVVEPQK